MSDTPQTSWVRDAAITYITEQYAEIFGVSLDDTSIIENNLKNMDDEDLKRELELLNGYYYQVEHIYTTGVSKVHAFIEWEERNTTTEPVFIL